MYLCKPKLMLEITLQDEKVYLLPERAIYWPRQRAIILADVHWGKTAHFRKHGIALPSSIQQEDAIKLSKLISQHNAEQLIIAGDLFHSKQNKEVDAFGDWRRQHVSLKIQLIEGNHDILPDELYNELKIEKINKQLSSPPFTIIHNMPGTPENDAFYIHGHVHPAVTITNNGRMGMKLDCFCVDDNRLMLPAFGRFTGRYKLKEKDYKQLYIIGEKEVIRWR